MPNREGELGGSLGKWWSVGVDMGSGGWPVVFITDIKMGWPSALDECWSELEDFCERLEDCFSSAPPLPPTVNILRRP